MTSVTHPDDFPIERDDPVDSDDENAGLDPSRVSVARSADADEADLIEQATAVPLDDDAFDH
ncbi:hypothetical protein DVS77_06705 [Mycolicibacterium moriokaense]|nr:hypothetical protein DVS77_06705 [Mycolicibacterium moriokaense]